MSTPITSTAPADATTRGTRALDDPATLAHAARIIREALARRTARVDDGNR